MKALPDVAPGHKKCAGGLFDGARLIKIAIEISIAAIYGVGRPQAIDAEQLEDEGSGGWQAAHGESGLRAAIQIYEFAGGQAVLPACVDQCVNLRKQIRVWIQQEEKVGVPRGDALIDGGGESEIFAIRDQGYVCPLADQLERPIARSVIHDNRFHVGSHLSERVEALSDDGFRVEGHDDRGNSQK
jgi:hypothetical protein